MLSESYVFGCILLCTFIVLILYVAFGQTTVRKLRKNPKTKNALGTEFASGWDIINVAQALALPRSWTKKLQSSPIAYLYANTAILLENTSKFDRIFAVIFYWLFVFSGFSLIMLATLSSLGVFAD